MKHLADLLGESPGIEAIRDKIVRLLERQRDARRLPPVLIEGETGTGKGLLARLIHRAGPRPNGSFVDVNCAAIPETLLEAEMFGFERGAFTDARRAKPGLFQAANRGTIFLDEVGLLSETLQAKLLKVIEERSVRRLGSTRDESIDVWILAATNEDLRAAIHARRFREDLYHRLAVLTLTLPPLRQRGNDILRLAEHFLGRACVDYSVSPKTLAADARAALRAYPWPGNVRELGNLMERVALLSSEPEVTADALGLPAEAEAEPLAPAPAGAASSLDDAVRDRVAEVLRKTDWNISRTASLLGISRNTLRARIEKYGLRSGEAPAPARRVEPRRARPSPASPAILSPAPSPPGSAALRWERRRVTLLRVTLIAASAPEPLETGRALELMRDKIQSFGGRIEGRSPAGVTLPTGGRHWVRDQGGPPHHAGPRRSGRRRRRAGPGGKAGGMRRTRHADRTRLAQHRSGQRHHRPVPRTRVRARRGSRQGARWRPRVRPGGPRADRTRPLRARADVRRPPSRDRTAVEPSRVREPRPGPDRRDQRRGRHWQIAPDLRIPREPRR